MNTFTTLLKRLGLVAGSLAMLQSVAVGQAVTLTPSPTGLHEEVTLTFDI